MHRQQEPLHFQHTQTEQGSRCCVKVAILPNAGPSLYPPPVEPLTVTWQSAFPL